ncbi:hypothetical protein [Iodobacter fluviatilis]|uniref:Uncharacterized protein n=1 Tax=Iodobacter fluviatilis TaxID=537 RepID=A0A7G3GFA2_9NEIS|nr:hypothetical protein [Iodobacter fluviatilis]QBC45859.1 hypothetical protein C1H71_20160 [Iodobacter fluviatilis]
MGTKGSATTNHTQPISARVDAKIYKKYFDLCDGRDCTVSELVASLLEKAIVEGIAESQVHEVEKSNAIERSKFSKIEMQRKLDAAKKQVSLFEAALANKS